ncbi:hypothetical protein M2189_006724 [Bradyrhizobium japonicum]|uniref:hypothetical protein n=1 Tax=Bradyrhizobium japonicum TaxID=375 RepID=UPI0021688FA2|nr:hypothetical protein [Bradyrhizobium japonicum]MCS3503759.1 hypothetical protein [Bradyrhizobium japonicum]MCS3963521.1 hypothetical protein [Bradyrhizobium japonicum]MCS3995834.1 hypothetical protein [Bradyrhizobium japonicum]
MLSPTTNTDRVRVPARLLLMGDVTSSGETVLGVSAGVATPRGKVEVSLSKGEHGRIAVWNAATIIVVRRSAAVPVENRGADEIPLSDRLPTFHELATFDAGKAWDRLSPEQQRAIGMLALRFGTVGQCEGYFHETIEGVRKGFNSCHWTPQVQDMAVWPRLHIQLVASAAQSAFQNLCDHFDPLWPQLFGWQTRKEVK